MTIYIDGILFLNFIFDFLLLLTTSLVLKRNVKIFNIIIGSFIGSLSILILFFKINSIQLFLIKIYLSVLMILITFNYKDIKYTFLNIVTFYLISFVLGGFLYFLNIEFSYKHDGLIFYNNDPSINFIFLFIICPIILYIYLKQNKYIRKKNKNFYEVSFKIGNKSYHFNGYMDSGNNLMYKKKPVIIIKHQIKTNKKKIYVPYSAIGFSGLLECIQVNVFVKDLGCFNVLLGMDSNLTMPEVDILLNNNMEGII